MTAGRYDVRAKPPGSPWDLEALRQCPSVEWEKKSGGVRELYYANERYRGEETRIYALYGSPDSEKGQVPAMVLVHGGGGRAFAEWVEMWVDRGYAALAMDLGGCGPEGERLSRGAGPHQDHQAKFLDIANGVKDAWPYHAVAAVIRGVSLLAERPEVDSERIGITGISWGGYLTCVVSGLDRRLRCAVPVYGCGFLHENSVWVPILNDMSREHRERWISNFEPSNYLPHAQLPMLWVSGTNDFAYPLDSYRKSYRAVPGPCTLRVTVGMEHGHEPGWAPEEIGMFADHHMRAGRPLASAGPVEVDGGRAWASCGSPGGIVGGGFHYTVDDGEWQERKWTSETARVSDGRVEANLPDERPLTLFFTVTDDRGALVSTEHRVVTP